MYPVLMLSVLGYSTRAFWYLPFPDLRFLILAISVPPVEPVQRSSPLQSPWQFPHWLCLVLKSSQVYFFNSRVKYTAKLHNTKLYSEIYTQQNYTIKSTRKYTEKRKNLLIQSIDNLIENTELKT